jgi:hypothetical protein
MRRMVFTLVSMPTYQRTGPVNSTVSITQRPNLSVGSEAEVALLDQYFTRDMFYFCRRSLHMVH